MTPKELKVRIQLETSSLASKLYTTEGLTQNRKKAEEAIEGALKEIVISAIDTVLDAYGEFSKVSPAYDRMRATRAEVKEEL